MLFPTVEYALFFLVAMITGWCLVRWHGLHKVALLGLSYIFYGFWNWRFIPLLVGLSVLAWWISLGIQRGRAPQAWLAAGILTCLGVLGWYKYAAFVTQSVLDLASVVGWNFRAEVPTPFLPLGISFMTFHAVSLMMDVSRGKLRGRISLVDVLLYVAFFPQLIAGPILRAHEFMPQLRTPPDPRRVETTRGLTLVALGLFKKVVIANSLASSIVDDVFVNPAGYSASQVLLAIYGYAVQIYCDFSGYTDIAIGCALLLGYRFPANFDSPYRSTNPQEFWRRWHISLSTWLREYVYVPLGGSRRGRVRTHISLMATMLLGGLWHGAAWTFVLWGAWHGLLLVLHREWDRYWSTHGPADWRRGLAWTLMSRVLLFHAVCLGWVLFRAESFSSAGALLWQLVAGRWQADWALATVLCIAVGLGLQYVPSRWTRRLHLRAMQWPAVVVGALFALAVSLIEILGPSGPAPFIYFQF